MDSSTSDDALVNSFHQAMLGIYDAALQHCKYHATNFLQMVNEQGGVQTARTLLQKEGIAYGLEELWRCGRLDISMEAVMLQLNYRPLFTADELNIARQRLKDLKHPPALAGQL